MIKAARAHHPVSFRWLYPVSAAAALIAAGLFLLALFSLALAKLQPFGWLAPFEDNWLVVIFKLHAGQDAALSARLSGLYALDLILLALIAILFAGLYAALQRTGRPGSILAAALVLAGIVLLFLTQNMGRSGVLTAEVVISVVMLRSRCFSVPAGWAGIFSGILLLAGDISLAVTSSPLLAILTAIGYILMVAWLTLIAVRLIRTEAPGK